MSDAPSPGFRIIGLRQESFKKIKLVDITPPRHLVKITGKNEQGKSSLIPPLPPRPRWESLGH